MDEEKSRRRLYEECGLEWYETTETPELKVLLLIYERLKALEDRSAAFMARVSPGQRKRPDIIA